MSITVAIERAAAALGQGDVAQAARVAGIIVAANPDTATAWRILGKAAVGLKDFERAERAFAESACRRPGSAERVHDLVSRAEPLICLGRPADAVSCVREAIQIGLTSPQDLFLAALALSHMGLPVEALPLAEKALALDPQLIDAWSLVANARQFMGEIDAAEAAFNTLVDRSSSRAAAAFYNLAHLRSWKPERNHIQQLESFQCRTSVDASRIGYALFKEYDDVGNIDAAWSCLQHAARVGRAMETWNGGNEKRTFDAWKAAFPKGNSRGDDMRRRSGPRRIFIVGLPRSGTTLVERILSSHSKVRTIGEVNTFAIATRRIANAGVQGIINPEIIAAAQVADPLRIAAEYTAQTAYFDDCSDYTIDKRPDNYEYVGLIRRAFPDAVVIILSRNPMDALFGAYKRAFAPGAHGWSYTFDDLATHYHNFKSLTDFWKNTLGDAVIEISLEALIAHPDVEIRRLLDRCGLEFDERCLRPHESQGAVTTASALQVRQPINAQGIDAWKRYGNQLQPLRDRLNSLGYEA